MKKATKLPIAKARPMTHGQYMLAIYALGLTQKKAARFLKVGHSTSRRYAAKGNIPHATAMLLRLMVERDITPQELGFNPEGGKDAVS